MKKLFLFLSLVVATGIMYSQTAVEISYNWEKENHICVTSNPINLSTIMTGEWSGPGIENNVFYPSSVPPESTTKLSCNGKEFVITTHPVPYVSLGWTPKEVKVGSNPIQLTGYPKGGKWSINGQSFDGNFYSETVGIYEIIYILTDEYGCTSGAVEHIIVK